MNKSFGRDDVRKVQRRINTARAKIGAKQIKVTGTFTSETVEAIQIYIASPGAHDGITSDPSAWVRKLQKQINDGTHSWGPVKEPAVIPAAAPITVDANTAALAIVKPHLENATDLVKAANAAGLEVAIAAALIEKESNGRNIFGHDLGGAYYGGGEVTEAKYIDFIAQVRSGKTSNGVGPAQSTWPGFFDDMEEHGLRPWVPYDNMLYGFRLLVSYLGGESTDAAIRAAGKRYNGNQSYGDDLVKVVAKWRDRLKAV